MSPTRGRAALGGLLVWAVLAARDLPAHAETPASLAQAAQLYDDGKRSFDLGDYPRAIASWEASYRLSSASLLLFNLGQAYRLAGDCGRANHFYLTYQRLEPNPPNPTELAAAMARCEGVAPTGVSVTPAVAASPPGAPPLAMVAGGEPRPEAPGRARPTYLRGAAAAVLGVGGVAAVAAASYAVIARRRAAEVGAVPAGTAWSPALAELEQAGTTAAGRARMFGVVSAVALVGGATLWWLGGQRGTVAVRVAVAPGHGEAVVACAF